MKKKTYSVYFQAMASHVVEVEANSPEEAKETAWNEATFPYFPGGMYGDIGDWDIYEVN